MKKRRIYNCHLRRWILIIFCLALMLFQSISSVTGAEEEMNTQDVAIDAINFPDESFCEYVKAFDIDENGKLSKEELSAVTAIDCSNLEIYDLRGIGFFTFLIDLNCANNHLDSLNLSNNSKLEVLNCAFNNLQELDVSEKPALTTLVCNSNQLISLSVFTNYELTKLICDENQLTSLYVANPILTLLSCQNNQLINLNVYYSGALTELYCNNNQLTSLYLIKNEGLTILSCGSNQLTYLGLERNLKLTELYCYDNQLTSLNVSQNEQLTSLICSKNNIKRLDIQNCPMLIRYTKEKEQMIGNTYLHWGTEGDGCLEVDRKTIVIPKAYAPIDVDAETLVAKGVNVYLDMLSWNLAGAPDQQGNPAPQFVKITDDTMYRNYNAEEGDAEAWVSAKYIFDTYLAKGKIYDSDARSYLYTKKTVISLIGDVNEDGVVDGRDSIRLMKYLAGEIDPETGEIYVINEENSDVTGDKEVDELDLLRIVRYLAVAGEIATLQ